MTNNWIGGLGCLVWRKEENLTSIKWKRIKYFSGTRFPVLWCVGRKLVGRYRGGWSNPDGVGNGGIMGEERRRRIGVGECCCRRGRGRPQYT